MQDEYFNPMAKETKAILEIARTEAPDITVSLHSHENHPIVLQPAYLPMFMKERVHDLALHVNNRYKNAGIDHVSEDGFWKPKPEDAEKLYTTFNLTSAVHHISGTMALTFECSHGSVSHRIQKPLVSFDDILDIELLLFDEMYDYILENRIYWE
jgi:hypothetical protein